MSLIGVVIVGVAATTEALQCAAPAVHTAFGLTACSNYTDLLHTASWGDCCAECGSKSYCTTWTWHENGVCTLAATPTMSRNASGTFSGTSAPLPRGPSKCHNNPPSPSPPGPACPSPPPLPKAKSDTPNIVLFLTDDMDHMLGGWSPMTKANELLAKQGAMAQNWFIHTPVCCPSRAELVTGRYFHNIRVPEPQDRGCMHVDMNNFYDNYFAPHLAGAGYSVGVFGKHLNSGNPTCAPDGIERWFVNGGGSYYNPTFTSDGADVTFSNGTYADYSTSVIGNVSLNWIKAKLTAQQAEWRPFVAYIAPKAPHIQDGPGWPVALPAPWYNNSFPSVKAPRTPNYNASCPDHHWLIRQQPPMTMEQADHADALFRSRWQALLSVDDLVSDVVSSIESSPSANKTYFIFTSDHGYRFGQFRMPQGKWNVYDNDIRIPFVIRGPGIAPDTTFNYPASQVDTMPTILGLAGVTTPSSMDGRSIAPLLISHADSALGSTQRHLAEQPAKVTWRTEQLVEYYGLGNVVRYEHLEDTSNNTFRALRVIDPTAAEGERNLMLAEFVDVSQWNFTEPASEFELFNLDADPYQLSNIYKTADPSLKGRLHASLDTLFRCRGSATCN